MNGKKERVHYSIQRETKALITMKAFEMGVSESQYVSIAVNAFAEENDTELIGKRLIILGEIERIRRFIQEGHNDRADEELEKIEMEITRYGF